MRITLLLSLILALQSCSSKGGSSLKSNEDLHGEFLAIQNIIPEYEKVDALNDQTIKGLYNALIVNPVTTLDRNSYYDPTGMIGFCYGRAIAAHLTSSVYGLKNESIKKLFIVGDLRANPANPEWRFHVTTIVQRDDGEWIALDPIMDHYPFIQDGQPNPEFANRDMPMKDWISNVRKVWDNHLTDESGNVVSKAYLYITSVDAILPDIHTAYANPALEPGTMAIQLNFDPSQDEGFTPDFATADNLYWLSHEAETKHFITASETNPSNMMDFTGIEINLVKDEGSEILSLDYNGYFADLFQYMLNAPIDEIRYPVSPVSPQMMESSFGLTAHGDQPKTDLHSMNFSRMGQ
jgi:hypothetical protein